MNHDSWLQFMADTATGRYTVVTVRNSSTDAADLHHWHGSILVWLATHMSLGQIYFLDAESNRHNRKQYLHEKAVIMAHLNTFTLWVRQDNTKLDPLVFKATFHK